MKRAYEVVVRDYYKPMSRSTAERERDRTIDSLDRDQYYNYRLIVRELRPLPRKGRGKSKSRAARKEGG